MANISNQYKHQISLLLRILPEVAKEKSFALYGGTAINLFIRDMPRLSVDIDLTYVPIEDRTISLANIAEALKRIKADNQKHADILKKFFDEDENKMDENDEDCAVAV